MVLIAPTRPSERPGRPVASQDRDSRALLLDTATALFAEHGVAATSFSTIARRAGLTPAMMHYHFRDREELMDAVVEERLVPLIHYVWDPVQPGEQPDDILRGLVRRLLEQVEQSPWVPSTWMREILNEGGLLRGRMLRRLPIEKVRLVGEAIAKGKAAGQVNSDIDPLLVVFSTLGLVMLHMATIRVWADVLGRSAPSGETMQRHITGLLLQGLSPEPNIKPEPDSRT